MGLSISIKGRGEPPAANKQICIFTKCRYAYVDIPMGLAIKKALEEGVLDFVVAYDIACKYSVKFWDRVTQHPDGSLFWTRPPKPSSTIASGRSSGSSVIFISVAIKKNVPRNTPSTIT